jgi:hypothetical protein
MEGFVMSRRNPIGFLFGVIFEVAFVVFIVSLLPRMNWSTGATEPPAKSIASLVPSSDADSRLPVPIENLDSLDPITPIDRGVSALPHETSYHERLPQFPIRPSLYHAPDAPTFMEPSPLINAHRPPDRVIQASADDNVLPASLLPYLAHDRAISDTITPAATSQPLAVSPAFGASQPPPPTATIRSLPRPWINY